MYDACLSADRESICLKIKYIRVRVFDTCGFYNHQVFINYFIL